MRLLVIIPAFNEQEALGGLLREIKARVSPNIFNIYGSTESGSCSAGTVMFPSDLEDEARIASFIGDALRLEGYSTEVARTGIEGLSVGLADRIDLVILDMVMPKLAGKDLFLAMRAINPRIRALLASGYSLNGEAQSILDAGVLAFLQKLSNTQAG